MEEWRAAHRGVLNTFQAILRNRTRGTAVSVAQRHKRKLTIFDKLQRIPGMQLARMDDVAGCRLIFQSIEDLDSFRTKFHKARFNHTLRNDPDKYDYIRRPKATGYRGIHDVYKYDVNSEAGKTLAGLYIEIQYRTLVQHAWATAVEVIGFITQSQPKFQKGDLRYERVMLLASEMLARVHEGRQGALSGVEGTEILREFLDLDEELGLMQTLRGLNSANSEVTDKRNSILIFSAQGDLEVRSFRDSTDALRALFELEREMPDRDIVLVRADTSDDVRLAFRNYFKDAREFVRLVDAACTSLSGRRVGRMRVVKKRGRR
ncbi:MAG: RelA/SpoT domain-containing protein [Immundisolibacter sp.]|uniref:RelA/SpoT domain-containing protein n=1 Tax=Immundisolibacter sp. TaxID=1934948 RepID=UPI003EE047FD